MRMNTPTTIITALLILVTGVIMGATPAFAQYKSLDELFGGLDIGGGGSLVPIINTTPSSSFGGVNAYTQTLLFIKTPQVPGPYEDMEIKAQSYTYDLDRTNLSWYIDDVLVQQGVGLRRLNIQTKGIGEPTVVRVVGATPGGQTIQLVEIMRPTHVAIAWEAGTYRPPFYKGKALHSASTFVTITAFPTILATDGSVIPPEDMVYSWKLGTQPITGFDGFGNQSITIQNTKFVAPMQISVDIETKDQTQKTRGEVIIPVDQPDIVFYENHPLLGILYNRAIGSSINLTDQELTIIAEPYHFEGTRRSAVGLERSWRIDQNVINANEEISLRPVGNAQGVSVIDLSLRSTKNIVQSARKEFRVTFKGTEDPLVNPFNPAP